MADFDYMRLSLRVGLFAGRADAYLGGDHFESKTHAVAWEFTQEMFDGWQAEARALGIPESVTTMTAEDLVGEDRIITLGMKLQRAVDRRSVH